MVKPKRLAVVQSALPTANLRPFVHLHNHSQFSLLDGHGLIDQYLDEAKSDGQTAFALTDHGNIAGAITLYREAKKRGVKPIIGCELYVDPGEYRETDYPLHLTVLALNEQGYRDLITANTIAAKNFYYRPRITIRDLIENRLMKNWVVLSGCMSGVVPRPLLDNDWAGATSILETLERNSAHLFVEVMWHATEDQEFAQRQDDLLKGLADIAYKKGLPLALTNDCHYCKEGSEERHQRFLREAQDKVAGIEFNGQGFYLKTQEEMFALAQWMGFEDAYENTAWIASQVDISIPEVDKVNWYVPDITGGKPEETILQICERALPGKVPTDENGRTSTDLFNQYLARFIHEMQVIKKSPPIMNSYLVAYDLIEWCRRSGIPAAARGSMAGSIVSWLLGITVEDPVRYKLLFERAVNPARPTIPDFDIDVSSERRQEVLNYLEAKYNDSRPICAYAAYGSKGAARMVMRVRGIPYAIANELSKELDDWNVVDWSFMPEDIRREVQPFAEEYQGFYANMTVHPAGLLLAGPERSLDHEVPMAWVASQKALASQYDMYTLKYMGLFKLDILGLRTHDQLAKMKAVSGAEAPLEYDDPEVFKAFDSGLVSEVFQMDGYACREAIKKVNVYNFEDIVAINSLVRPGAMQFLSVYRAGNPRLIAEYPPLEPILGYTNGLIIYQEQVMQICGELADFDDAEQDDVKEAIKYFKADVFNKDLAPKFNSRCQAKGFNPANIWNTIVQFAGYAFNRAHAVSYAGIAYRMMWYKVYHPAAFYAAVFDDCADRARLILESHYFGVGWELADVNRSEAATTVTVEGNVIMGLTSIKGIGPATVETLLEARASGPFTSDEDVEARVNRRKCTVSKRKILQDVGAYSFSPVMSKGRVEEAYGFGLDIMDSDLAVKVTVKEGNALGGFILGSRETQIKRGDSAGRFMGILSLTSLYGESTAVMYPEVWAKAKRWLQGTPAVILRGYWKNADGKGADFIVQSGEVYESATS